eukprot:scaffold35693_cov129-Isochrysis_galbana.AAC.2
MTQQRAFTSTESQRASELYRLAARGKSKSGGANDIRQTRSSSRKRLHNRALPTRQPALSHRRGRGGAPHAQINRAASIQSSHLDPRQAAAERSELNENKRWAIGNNKERQDNGLSVRSQLDLGGLGPGGHEHEAKRTRANIRDHRSSREIRYVPARPSLHRP